MGESDNITDLTGRLPRPDRRAVAASVREVAARPDLTLDDLLAGPIDEIRELGQYGPVVGSSDAPARLAAIADTFVSISRVPMSVAIEAMWVLLGELDPEGMSDDG
ncbi:MAG: hypothetical protein U5K30_01440 [Acidimicrobiales bacterium]|nr:hypothetical protein [Acidimicrobiales bacterium]